MSSNGGLGGWSTRYGLYALTTFLSAFLIFVIQPMVGKHLLPWFGGSSSVWATSLLFFTSMLFVGYAYVYVLTRYGGRHQARVHVFVVAGLALVSLGSLSQSLQWTVGDQGAPALNVLIALLGMIGAPYFLLSTTGPLLQYWWGLAANKEPYKLYALSNIGSLLALLGYVALIEPNITLPDQEFIWLGAFFVYALLALILSIGVARVVSIPKTIHEDGETIPLRRWVAWLLLAALPAFVLVAGTTSITQTIAPVPLLWIVPLMLYLLTLIVAFEGMGQIAIIPFLTIAAAYAVYSYIGTGPYFVSRAIAANLAFIFMAGLLCHTWLYRLRPHISRLPLFYLFVSFGGMLGVFFASLVAPLVFSEFIEFPLSLAVVAALAALAMPLEYFPRIMSEQNVRLTKIVFVLMCAGLYSNYLFADTGAPYIASRNFYGSAKIRFDSSLITLLHGTTVHGYQPREHDIEYVPNSYYVPTSGMGRAMAYQMAQRGDEGIRVGVLGLGTGSISAYCRSGAPGMGKAEDTFVFYEIDPRMLRLASDYFSYLIHCKGSSVRLGDGRLLLEQERRNGELGKYDIIAADAFTDDTVPVHLITQQAIALYLSHTRSPQSIIAVHTSNRYLNLPPVILKIASTLGLTAKVISDDGSSSPIGSSSQWVLLVKDPDVFKDPAFAGASDFLVPNMQQTPLWTDSYASLLSVFRW